jgi:hypothetical protein
MATFAGNAEGVMGDTPPMNRLHPSRLPGGCMAGQPCSSDVPCSQQGRKETRCSNTSWWQLWQV